MRTSSLDVILSGDLSLATGGSVLSSIALVPFYSSDLTTINYPCSLKLSSSLALSTSLLISALISVLFSADPDTVLAI